MTDTAGNRTDLLTPDPSRPPGEPSADTYGQGVQREEQARALPTVSRRPVLGPTTRPDEPVTAGLPVGPGVGHRPLPGRADSEIERLRELVAISRDPQLAILLGRLEARRQ